MEHEFKYIKIFKTYSAHGNVCYNPPLGATAFVKRVYWNHRQTSIIRRTLLGNKIVDYSDVIGVSPVGAAPTISSFST